MLGMVVPSFHNTIVSPYISFLDSKLPEGEDYVCFVHFCIPSSKYGIRCHNQCSINTWRRARWINRWINGWMDLSSVISFYKLYFFLKINIVRVSIHYGEKPSFSSGYTFKSGRFLKSSASIFSSLKWE